MEKLLRHQMRRAATPDTDNDSDEYVTRIEVVGTSTFRVVNTAAANASTTAANFIAQSKNQFQRIETQVNQFSEKTKVPPWAIVLSVSMLIIIVVLVVFLLIRKFCKGLCRFVFFVLLELAVLDLSEMPMVL